MYRNSLQKVVGSVVKEPKHFLIWERSAGENGT